MASTAEGSALTRIHRQQQLRISREAIAEGVLLWRTVNPDDLAATADNWAVLALRSILNFRRLSALLAARYMQSFRVAEIGQPLRPDPAAGLLPIGNGAVLPRGATLFDDAVRTAIITALRVNGTVALQRGIERGLPPQQASDAALARVAGVTQKGVLDGGRETQAALIRADARVEGVARVTSGNACAFCTMLASRMFAYKSEATADFEAHPGCSCSTEVFYEGTEPTLPPSSLRAAQEWSDFVEASRSDDFPYEGGASLGNFRRWRDGVVKPHQPKPSAAAQRTPETPAAMPGEQTAARRSSVDLQLQQLRDRRDAATPAQRDFIESRIAELEAEQAAI